MSAMAVTAPAVPQVRIGRPAPWSFALVGALAVAVVAGGSVAATQAVLGDRLDDISVQVSDQARRADAAEARLRPTLDGDGLPDARGDDGRT